MIGSLKLYFREVHGQINHLMLDFKVFLRNMWRFASNADSYKHQEMDEAVVMTMSDYSEHV